MSIFTKSAVSGCDARWSCRKYAFKIKHAIFDDILTYVLSYRDIEELMDGRGFFVDHSTINR